MDEDKTGLFTIGPLLPEIPLPEPNRIIPGFKPLCVGPNWPVVYKHRYFKTGDIVANTITNRFGVVTDSNPSCTYPGDIAIATKESNFQRGYNACPDSYRLVWRNE